MFAAPAWFTHQRRVMKVGADRLLGYLWLCALGGALLLSAQQAYQRSLRVEEYAFACDPFGYLRMAKEVRQAVSKLELPQFHLESTHTRLLIDLMQSQHLPPALWEEMVAPHAHHYFPRAGSVGVQYPPGTGLMLALFPEGRAVDGLNRATIALFLATGILVLILAGARQAWVSAGFVTLALHLGLGILGGIGTASFSINAVVPLLLLAFVCVCAAFGFAIRAREGSCPLGCRLVRWVLSWLCDPGSVTGNFPAPRSLAAALARIMASIDPRYAAAIRPWRDRERHPAVARSSIPDDRGMVPLHLWK